MSKRSVRGYLPMAVLATALVVASAALLRSTSSDDVTRDLAQQPTAPIESMSGYMVAVG
jgi:hypothetical protein